MGIRPPLSLSSKEATYVAKENAPLQSKSWTCPTEVCLKHDKELVEQLSNSLNMNMLD